MNREPKPIDSPRDILAGLSDEERMAFLEEHGVSEYFLENVEEASEEERPGPRTRPINIRFDDFTLGRLKALAASRNVGYQTLLKTFVQERLYEEEKRTWTRPIQEAPVEQPAKQRRGD
jgi:predicted DNA binding CopG/RHH family protein